MKRSLITILFVCLAFYSHGQGTIFVNNFNNTGVFGGAGGTPFNGTSGNPVYSPLVTSNGLIFTLDATAQAGNLGYGGGSQMLGVDVNFALYGGATAGTATNLIESLTGTNGAAFQDNANWGQITGGGAVHNVPGTAGAGTGFFDLQVWEGTATSYAASTGYKSDTGVFQSLMSSGLKAPLPLYGMPDILLTIPEPSFFALSVLGAIGVFWRRRRNPRC